MNDRQLRRFGMGIATFCLSGAIYFGIVDGALGFNFSWALLSLTILTATLTWYWINEYRLWRNGRGQNNLPDEDDSA